ncbi:hypothetical protein NC651_034849 [Populus alba x Populus x berolinensis]|nr:hypothetical protein NC651_034849 [Populus alba x Populus x berolinensis]
MMICSSFILNQTQNAGEWTIYPWIHSNCNSLSDRDQLRPVSFPDIHPASAGITEGFSMCGGDIVEVYSDPSQKTRHGIIGTNYSSNTLALKVWINLGPLLYHFADMHGQEDEMSIELSLEDVKCVAFDYGFEVEKEKTIETTYATNPRSMMQLQSLPSAHAGVVFANIFDFDFSQNRYFAAFWTMRKKSAAAEKLST